MLFAKKGHKLQHSFWSYFYCSYPQDCILSDLKTSNPEIFMLLQLCESTLLGEEAFLPSFPENYRCFQQGWQGFFQQLQACTLTITLGYSMHISAPLFNYVGPPHGNLRKVLSQMHNTQLLFQTTHTCRKISLYPEFM